MNRLIWELIIIIALVIIAPVKAVDMGNIYSGETIVGDISINGQTDSFAFNGVANQGVVIEEASINGSLGSAIYLYNPNGTIERSVIGGSYTTCIRLENHQLKETGIYTIVITASGASYTSLTGEYDLSLLLIPGATSSDQDPDGGNISSGETTKGTIDQNGDTDAFIFYGKQGQGVVIEEAYVNGSLGSAIYLYNPNGTIEISVIGGSYTTRIRLENHQLKETGIYTIVITASGASYTSLTGEYSLSFLKIPSTLPPGIYNPFPADKTRISNLNQSFKWDAVPDATGYDLYFGEDVIMPLFKIGEDLSSPEMAFLVMEMNKIYYWHVEAHTPNGTIYGPYWWFSTHASNISPISICGPDRLKCENVGAPVQFNGSASYDPDGTIASFKWDFGDGTNGTGAAPKHTYASYRWNGTAYRSFTANLTVTDNSGLANTTSQKVVMWIQGDANGDGKVNILDASIIGLKWVTADSCADLNNDGKVTILDASIIGLNWGKTPIIQ